MPRAGRGFSRGGHGRKSHVKPGTTNPQYAAARDERAAAAARNASRAQRLAAQQAEAAEMSPAPRPHHQKASPLTESTYEPSRAELAAHKRVAIIYKYEQLGCPISDEWGMHGGTLRQIADHLGMPKRCDYRPIRECLERYLADDDVMKPRPGQGRKPVLQRGQQLVAADCLQRGTGQEQAAPRWSISTTARGGVNQSPTCRRTARQWKSS